MNHLVNSNLVEINYDAIRQAMNGEPYPMSLVSKEEITAVVKAVNQGIDSHLEACNCPERGDSYIAGKRYIGNTVVAHTLECVVSVESMPTLLRRLFENDNEGEGEGEGSSLAESILDTLGLND